MAQASFDDIQKAFVEGRISFYDLFIILIDNYGAEKTFQIIKENLGEECISSLSQQPPWS